MRLTKKIISLWVIAMIATAWTVRWAKVTLQPLYSDVRFQPSDQLHAGCTNSADIIFSPQGQKITKFTLVLYYNPENLEIVRILPKIPDGSASSKIEYNKIILEVQNPTFDISTESKSFFELYFKSDSIGAQTLTLWTGSQAIAAGKSYPLQGNFELVFADVPECEPDIIPPSLSLIYPKDTTARIALDQYFVFDIKDIGKWVDKRSVIINFDGEQYRYGSDNIKRNGNYLTFYPGTWIPINKPIDLEILIWDKQSYGGPNETQNIFNFKSATGMLLNKYITPMMFRQIAQNGEKIAASSGECALLAQRYPTAPLRNQILLKSIIQKVWCDLATLQSLPLTWEDTTLTTSDKKTAYMWLSVFASIGWILFFITFTLKMHYLVSYKKHKKINKATRIHS